MIDPIVAHPPVNPLVRLEWAQLDPAVLPEVSAADQARFQAALRPLPESPTVAQSALPPVVVAESSPLTPGDAILQNLDRLRTGYRDLTLQMETLAGQSQISPQQLLSLQMQVSQVTLNTQLVSQVASKIEQDINTLLKSS